jgi:hypothetical protein
MCLILTLIYGCGGQESSLKNSLPLSKKKSSKHQKKSNEAGLTVVKEVKFGEVLKDSTKTIDLTLRNENDTESVTDILFTLSSPAFVVENPKNCPQIKALDHCAFKVAFVPKIFDANLNESLTINYKLDGKSKPPIKVMLKGKSNASPLILEELVAPKKIDFGKIQNGAIKEIDIDLQNKNKNHAIINISFISSSPYFTVNKPHNCTKIDPSNKCSLKMIFSPVIFNADFNESLTINYMLDGKSKNIILSLKGKTEKPANLKNIIATYKTAIKNTPEELSFDLRSQDWHRFAVPYVNFARNAVDSNSSVYKIIVDVIAENSKPYQSAFAKELHLIFTGAPSTDLAQARADTVAQSKAITSSDQFEIILKIGSIIGPLGEIKDFDHLKDKMTTSIDDLNKLLKANYGLAEPNDLSEISMAIKAINLSGDDFNKIKTGADAINAVEKKLQSLIAQLK